MIRHWGIKHVTKGSVWPIMFIRDHSKSSKRIQTPPRLNPDVNSRQARNSLTRVAGGERRAPVMYILLKHRPTLASAGILSFNIPLYDTHLSSR
ncbi:Uncharacterized protein HZ326_26405 [Fusarium oxysporum f. sp. albedinis]|nr:Uncharacterized protein HZ326_26405 [Fusarium oxysporum f. sp. albedinis]